MDVAHKTVDKGSGRIYHSLSQKTVCEALVNKDYDTVAAGISTKVSLSQINLEHIFRTLVKHRKNEIAILMINNYPVLTRSVSLPQRCFGERLNCVSNHASH